MIDERFSAKKFDQLGLDSDAAGRLAQLLAEEVTAELHAVIEPAFRAIVDRVNQMGHNLGVEEIGPGEITFRDDREDEDGYHCRLRLAVDTIVSSGYAHLSDGNDGD